MAEKLTEAQRRVLGWLQDFWHPLRGVNPMILKALRRKGLIVTREVYFRYIEYGAAVVGTVNEYEERDHDEHKLTPAGRATLKATAARPGSPSTCR